MRDYDLLPITKLDYGYDNSSVIKTCYTENTLVCYGKCNFCSEGWYYIMKSVILISCSKRKRSYPCEAQLLYDESTLFKKTLAYAQTLSHEIFVLSGRYGIIPLNEIIAPYDETPLKEKPSEELIFWAHKVVEQLMSRFMSRFDIQEIEFIIFAEEAFYLPLQGRLKHIKLPFFGLSKEQKLAKIDELMNHSIS